MVRTFHQLAQNSFEGVDVEAVAEGVKAALLGQPSAVEDALMRTAFDEIQKRMQAQQSEQAKGQSAAGAAFLAETRE